MAIDDGLVQARQPTGQDGFELIIVPLNPDDAIVETAYQAMATTCRRLVNIYLKETGISERDFVTDAGCPNRL